MTDCSSLLLSASSSQQVTPIFCVLEADWKKIQKRLTKSQKSWADLAKFGGKQGQLVKLPDELGQVSGILLGLGDGQGDSLFATGKIAAALGSGVCELVVSDNRLDLYLLSLGFVLGSYSFDLSSNAKEKKSPKVRLKLAKDVDRQKLVDTGNAIYMGRTLINRPANDLGPEAYESFVRGFAKDLNIKLAVTKGDVLARRYPLHQAVGRAASEGPRLFDLRWGNKKHPKVTLVGKGLCYDTGGLNLKPGSSMNLMKKDMGGSATALTLASMIVRAELPIQLRVLIPVADNAISGNSFRPGDVLKSYKGDTVEIYNTDAEGRLVLADALAYGDEDAPDLMVSFATLTGAARVATGPDLPPFYVDDETIAGQVQEISLKNLDPVWRLPFWSRYKTMLKSNIADINHCAVGGFAGSITAALFLKHFTTKTKDYMHFDIYGWTPTALPARPKGGEPQGARTMFDYLESRYGN